MSFMDKVKAKAQDVATEAKKAADKGKSKVDELQLKKKQDEAAKQLGYLIYAERTSGTPGGAEVDRLISEISSLGSQINEASSPPSPPQA